VLALFPEVTAGGDHAQSPYSGQTAPRRT
jgi:hypothetical protein